MLTRLGFSKLVSGAPCNHNFAMTNIVLEKRFERKCAWLFIYQGQHVGVECALHGCIFEQRIQDAVRIGIALQLYNHTHALTVRLVAYIRDAIDLFVASQFGNFLHKFGFIDLVGQLCCNDTDASAL